MSQPEDAVSCSHDVEAANDGASTDVAVVALVVRVLLQRHLTKTKIGHLRRAHTLCESITDQYCSYCTCHFQVLGAALWPPMTLPFFTKDSPA